MQDQHTTEESGKQLQRITIAELIEHLSKMPQDAIVTRYLNSCFIPVEKDDFSVIVSGKESENIDTTITVLCVNSSCIIEKGFDDLDLGIDYDINEEVKTISDTINLFANVVNELKPENSHFVSTTANSLALFNDQKANALTHIVTASQHINNMAAIVNADEKIYNELNPTTEINNVDSAGNGRTIPLNNGNNDNVDQPA